MLRVTVVGFSGQLLFFFAYALPSYERTESGNKEGRGTSFFMSSFAYLFDEKEKRRERDSSLVTYTAH